VVFAALLAVSGWLGARLFSDPEHLVAFRLMLVNTFLISLTFVPFHLMRLRGEAVTYSALVFARSAGTVVTRVGLVIGMGWGLAGWFAADLVLTIVLLPVLWRWMRPLIRFQGSAAELRTVLRFGLPRLPHGLAQQALDAGNKLLLNSYVPGGQLGVYQNGFTLGTAVRFFTSAFETAWAPFYYETARKPDAAQVLAKLTTYVMAILALLVAVTTAISGDLILVMLTPEYLGAATVMPFIALGMGLQGVYLLTSIGLNLTSRTQYYPVATFAALAVGLGSGVLLMPRYGMTGAAVAFLLSAATQALVAFLFSRRFYPLPYETGRLLRVVVAGIAATGAAVWLIPDWPPFVSVLARAVLAAIVFAVVLGVTGFFRGTERAFIAEVLSARRARVVIRPGTADDV
jgi:O-antigen/teichoic acid export membrane protein